jgi:branched-chain amino acid aminotransferase
MGNWAAIDDWSSVCSIDPGDLLSSRWTSHPYGRFGTRMGGVGEITGMAWINGEFAAAEDAKISIFDSGFIGGVAIFDTMACWQGNLFKLPVHLARFERSAHAAMVPLLLCGDELKDVVIETTRRSGLRDAYVQALATRGRRPSPSAWSNERTLIVYAVPYVWMAPREKIARGISVIVPSVRNWSPTVIDPKVKNFNRLHSYFARLEADRQGADDVVMVDEHGLLTESRGSNVFVVRASRLYTPTSGILEGITRETVFEIAAEFGLPAAERDLTPYDLYVADEAFLCTTAGGIIPVVEADGRRVGTGKPGPITMRITDRYWERHLDGPDTTPVFR